MCRNLLWVDGLAAASAGVLMLAIGDRLSSWYQLPPALLQLIGLVSLGYATYSLSLAMRARRPRTLIVLLVIANSLWAAACLRWAVVFAPTASPWGLAHLLGESAFVGGLALLEWRWWARLATPVEAAA
ncbi:hypothetical protein HNE05_03815 [Aquipseudomonas campi]|uniref:DUF4345 domain-containing protein n=1 Tax=Aquipseudomonas campi TaxID=2731681 RepID=A0A6M8FXJ5_9GAMM|nr:hypothetical protein HNE05_03815 [Pseudomonas campi]